MNLDLSFYWALLLRRLPVMLALFLICSVTATVNALKQPPTYSTSALILVESPQIPSSMVQSVVPMDASRQLQVIEQRLLTRVNMLDIARKFNVFEDMRTMKPDTIVENMRRQTGIRLTGGRDQATLMRISFKARWGTIAADVVNEYVTLVLQESTDFRMDRAESALAFFEQEVQRLNDDLSLQSAKVIQFKSENSKALPSDLGYRQNRQSLLQERQARLERDIAALEKQRRDMVVIFETTGRVAGPDTDEMSSEERRLVKFRSDLDQALTVYSDTNPRIVLLKNRIARLEQSIQLEATSGTTGETAQTGPATMLDVMLTDIDQRVSGMQEQLEQVVAGLEDLESSIQATAGNAIALQALERDFANIQSRYNDAVRNLDKARVSERIEVSAQGQRISAIENASVPQRPSGPNRFKLIAAGVGAGGALAIGFFMLLELLNRNIRRPLELQSKFGIIPLAVIPYMESKRERVIRRTALISAVLAVLIGVPAVLWYIDTSYMPLDILANKVFDRLGLT